MIIYSLCCDPTGSIFTAEEFKNRVHVFDWKERRKIATVDCLYIFGGHRTALHLLPRPTLVTGGWSNLSVYDLEPEPRLRYRIRNLKEVQAVYAGIEHVAVGLERSSMKLFDPENGALMGQLRSIRRLHWNLDQSIAITESERQVKAIHWPPDGTEAIFKLPKGHLYFAVEGGSGRLISQIRAYEPPHFVVSFHDTDGKERWRHDLFEDCGFLYGTWHEHLRRWILVRSDPPRGMRLYSVSDGRDLEEFGYVEGIWSVVFLNGGTHFASTDGFVRDSLTLELVWQFANPDRLPLED
jgi:hypothetical protein